MRPTRSISFMLASLYAGLIFAQPSALCAAAEDPAEYQTPTSAQLQKGEELFALLFARQPLANARECATALGFSWRETESEISLVDEGKKGWGDFRFSKHTASGIALQAPHRFHDKYTGTIAKALFAQHGFDSIALNSLSRRTPTEDNAGLTADLTRLPDSFHSVYSRAFTSQHPRGQLVQIHGFDPKKRLSPQARQTNVILSTGSSRSSRYLLGIQQCFIDGGWDTLRYPQQVRELGATKNSIGILLRNLGHSGFIHIELDLATRMELKGDRDRLKYFAECLQESVQ